VAQKQGYYFAVPPFCEIETKDFIASGTVLGSNGTVNALKAVQTVVNR
jgi:hypothetical protein